MILLPMRMMVANAVLALGVGYLFPAASQGETLRATLRSAEIPTDQFEAEELDEAVTSYAINPGAPSLLAYYVDDGSEMLKQPLRVIRYDQRTRSLRRSELRDISTLFASDLPMGCMGAALSIREYAGLIYVETHLNPSAGCVIVLSSELKYKVAISGWLLGLMGGDYAIVETSEVHFLSVQPLHVRVLNLHSKRSVQVYPFRDDPFRRSFSKMLSQRMALSWCQENNAPCDPDNFDVSLVDRAVNEPARVFGLEVVFDAEGFGTDATKEVPRTHIVYVFREREGAWEHRAFVAKELKTHSQVETVGELVAKLPAALFGPGAH